MQIDLLWPATWWSTHGNHFFRTEAIDLLKTNDRSRDRTQYEPISEVHQGGRQKAGIFGKTGQVVWFMSRCNLMRTAALFPRGKNGTVEGLGATPGKQRMSPISGPEHLGEPVPSGRQSALPAL